jgi:AcrR family transcriptional regulator
MRPRDPELEIRILAETLNLLLIHEPYEIGMRDIATACHVSATAIYHYYEDKTALFEAVKLHCLTELKLYMKAMINEQADILVQIRTALDSFAQWCFDNPRKAFLVMGKLKANTSASKEELQLYYECNELGLYLIEKGIAEHRISSDNPRLDTSIAISALWGTIEGILLNRADPEYWNRGKAYTDRFINQYLTILSRDIPEEKE